MQQRYTIKVTVVPVDAEGNEIKQIGVNYQTFLNSASTNLNALWKYTDRIVEYAEEGWNFNVATDSARVPEEEGQ